MSKQRMVSETRGLGNLLTERRYFAVPAHQRDYAWPSGAVEEYLYDVVDAMHTGASEYFLGLIVLVDTDDSTSKRYEILDGQQRLATTTMIYAAIRNWLTVNGFTNEATRIQNDFIGISEIGENEHEPRIIMNIGNQDIFQEIVVNQCGDDLIEKRQKDSGRHSSTRKLVEATALCRAHISRLADQQGSDRTNQPRFYLNLPDTSEIRYR